MKKFKKSILAMVSMLLVFSFVLTACGGGAEDDAETPDVVDEEVEDDEEEEEVVEDEEEEEVEEDVEEDVEEEDEEEDDEAAAEDEEEDEDEDVAEDEEDEDEDTDVADGDDPTGFPTDFAREVSNDDEAIEGGVLKFGLSGDAGFEGKLNPVYQTNVSDATVLEFSHEGVLEFTEGFQYSQDGMATFDYDVDEKTFTLNLQDGLEWHDGEAFTLDDLLFAYEVIGHPDYEGTRYGPNSIENIVGAVDYHEGNADGIEGVTVSEDGLEMVIELVEFTPATLYNGLWMNPVPRHKFEGVEVADMESHASSREAGEIVGNGPFKIVNIVPGESVEYEAYEDYYKGAPKLDGVVLEAVDDDMVPSAMENGEYDICDKFSPMQYPDYDNPENFSFVGQLERSWGYMGFKLGTRDGDTNTVDPDAKMANVDLRKAIAYAMDNEAVNEDLYNGLRMDATSPITPRHYEFRNPDQEGYPYSPEKAEELLDEAGYVDVDGDGFREDPEGEELTIYMAMMSGEESQSIAEYYMQNWEDVGLRVELFNDRLIDMNAFYEYIENDEEGIDMYQAGWRAGYNPTPNEIWGENAAMNYTRYTSDALQGAIDAINALEVDDDAARDEAYYAFQEAFMDELPGIPLNWRIQLMPVNNRVKNFSIVDQGMIRKWHLVELTEEEPVV